MSKVTTPAVFKPYDQQQILLLPPRLDELISPNHLVRVVNSVVENLDLSSIVNQYEGGGTSAFHPKMMVKIWLYGYATKVYTGRKLARALRQDVTFMWLAAYNRPDFRTLNLFRSGVLKETIEELFKELLLFLAEQGYVRMEDYFTDGTVISADANKYKIVWRKNALRYKQMAEKKCRELFTQVEKLNAEEDRQYGDHDLEETGQGPVDDQVIDQQIEKLNGIIQSTEKKRQIQKARFLKKKVEEQRQKIAKYEEQLTICDQRSGYSSTDQDATALYLKSDELVPAYNVLASSENQYITGFSIHQNPNDATCFKEHIEKLPAQPQTLTADSAFGSEQNYEILENRTIEAYVKYQNFHLEQTRKHRQNPFAKENFTYQPLSDSYICPKGRKLTYRHTEVAYRKKTGYSSTFKVYKSEDCSGCEWAQQCKKPRTRYRTVTVSERYEYYKQLARQNLNSEKGIALRKRRGMEIESCFGDIKQNMDFRRFHLRSKRKVKTEFGMIAIAHNIRKLHLEQVIKAA